jgi:hypothetical protein
MWITMAAASPGVRLRLEAMSGRILWMLSELTAKTFPGAAVYSGRR